MNSDVITQDAQNNDGGQRRRRSPSKITNCFLLETWPNSSLAYLWQKKEGETEQRLLFFTRDAILNQIFLSCTTMICPLLERRPLFWWRGDPLNWVYLTEFLCCGRQSGTMMEWQSSTGRSLGRRASQFEAISSKAFQTRTSTVLFGPGIAVMQHPPVQNLPTQILRRWKPLDVDRIALQI